MRTFLPLALLIQWLMVLNDAKVIIMLKGNNLSNVSIASLKSNDQQTITCGNQQCYGQNQSEHGCHKVQITAIGLTAPMKLYYDTCMFWAGCFELCKCQQIVVVNCNRLKNIIQSGAENAFTKFERPHNRNWLQGHGAWRKDQPNTGVNEPTKSCDQHRPITIE